MTVACTPRRAGQGRGRCAVMATTGTVRIRYEDDRALGAPALPHWLNSGSPELISVNRVPFLQPPSDACARSQAAAPYRTLPQTSIISATHGDQGHPSPFSGLARGAGRDRSIVESLTLEWYPGTTSARCGFTASNVGGSPGIVRIRPASAWRPGRASSSPRRRFAPPRPHYEGAQGR